MTENFLTFQRFNDEELAKDLIDKLNENGIPLETEDSNKFFDPTFALNPLSREISVKLRPGDFEVAQKLLANHYKAQLDSVDPDYYLFTFSDQELAEIILKPDEWGDFDYQLAQKILSERGKEIKPEVADLLRKQRIDELAKPETSHRYVVVIGYFSAFFGGLLGILIGWHLSYSKKTLPDGRSIYRYTEKERDDGTRILLVGTVCFVIWFFVRYFFMD
jgi:hypothetical protein